jgi:tetratricopeptide (TPR) repeat protein
MLTFYQSNAQVDPDTYNMDSLQKILKTQKGDAYKNAMQMAKEALTLSKKLQSKKPGGNTYQYHGDSSGDIINDLKIPTINIPIPKLPFIDSDSEEQENDSEVLKKLNASLKIMKDRGDKKGMAQIYNAIGRIYSKQGKYNEALDQQAAALKIFQQPGMPGTELPGSYMSIATTYINQGDMLSEKGDISNAVNQYTEAFKNASLALKGWRDAGKKDGIAKSYLSLGNLNIKLNNPL